MTEIETDFAAIISRVVTEGDNERLRSFTSLLNTINYAVQVQSDRLQWEPKDFRAFCIALCAMDQIGQIEPEREKRILRSVETATDTRVATA